MALSNIKKYPKLIEEHFLDNQDVREYCVERQEYFEQECIVLLNEVNSN